MYDTRSKLASIEEKLVKNEATSAAAAPNIVTILDKLAADAQADRNTQAIAMRTASNLAKEATLSKYCCS